MFNHSSPGPPGDEQIEAWIDEAKQGSSEALGQLLEACRQYLLGLANRQMNADLKCKISASDLVQETSLDAYKDILNFRGQRLEELLAWLRRILLYNAANASRHYQGTAKRQLSRELPLELHPTVADNLAGDVLSPRSLLVAHEEQAAVERALDRLSEDQRTAILLRSREHYSFAEVGAFMNRSSEAARKLWFRAIERLQQELASDDTA